MNDTPLIAHSLAETHCYLMVTPCAACGKGPLAESDDSPTPALHDSDDTPCAVTDDTPLVLNLETTCKSCGDRAVLRFELPHGKTTPSTALAPTINPTDEPSRIIDVAQWITLFRVITEAAAGAAEKTESRRLGLEAALCLEEALKFFDEPDNAVPPAEAFFHDASRERFKRNPEQFAKDRLIALRAKLPSVAAMKARLAADRPDGAKKRWWKRSP